MDTAPFCMNQLLRDLPSPWREWPGAAGPPHGVRYLPGSTPGVLMPGLGVALGGGVGLVLAVNALLELAAYRSGLPTTAERLLMGPLLAGLCLLFGAWAGAGICSKQ